MGTSFSANTRSVFSVSCQQVNTGEGSKKAVKSRRCKKKTCALFSYYYLAKEEGEKHDCKFNTFAGMLIPYTPKVPSQESDDWPATYSNYQPSVQDAGA
jgi:hypothetical protein